MPYAYPVHKHPVYDTDVHFIIDPITREVGNPELKKTLLMQNDHNSERFSFECERYIEGHDMLLCDMILVHYNNIGSNRRTSQGVYEIDDMVLSPNDETKIVFTWLISDQATMYAGSLNFLITFSCTEQGDSVYRWNSSINKSIIIATGMNNTDYVVESYPDILAQWRAEIMSWERDLNSWRSKTDQDLYKWKTDTRNEVLNTNYAYKAAVENGFNGTIQDWLASLKGERGDTGIYVGSEEPGIYPYFWFKTDDTLTSFSTRDFEDATVMTQVAHTLYRIKNATANKGPTEDKYDFTVI